MNNTLRMLVQKIPRLPTLPAVAEEILGLMGDDSSQVMRLEGIIEKDPAITAKVLGLSNSAFFGIGRPVTNINDAIMRIGFTNVKNIAMGISLMTLLHATGDKEMINYRRIFRHSIAVGIISRLLAERFAKGATDHVFSGGLLHDLGFMVLNKYFGSLYERILQAAFKGGSIIEAELSVLGVTHAEIGTWIAEQWRLPRIIVDVIYTHHRPSMSQGYSLEAALVHLADIIAAEHFYGVADGEALYDLDPSALVILRISEGLFRQAASELPQDLFSDSVIA